MASEHLLILKDDDDGGGSHADAFIGLEPLPSSENDKNLSLQQESIDRKALQYAQDQFQQAYQHKPQFVARAPGRVNIIGEHIDYNGFGVFPMALQQSVFVACSKTQQQKQEERQPSTVELNIQSTSSGSKPCHVCYTVDELWSRIKASSESEQPPFDSTDRDWSHYVLCAIFGVLEGLLSLSSNSEKSKAELTQQLSQQSISLLIHGTVPQGAGVSSSSALVVASAMAFWTLLLDHNQQQQQQQRQQHELSRKQMAALCAKCERWVGTEGGGMDQAISIFAQAGQGRYIQFQPTFQHKAIPLLEGARWVVCHSLEESHKRLDAATQFNKRVVECKVACRWLAQILLDGPNQENKDDDNTTFPTLLWELVHTSGKSFHELETIAREKIPETVSRAELVSFVMGDTVSLDVNNDNGTTSIIRQLASQLGIVRPAGVTVLTLAESYCVRDRLLHVLTETRRVQEFVALCCDDDPAQGRTAAAAKLEALGRLLTESHRSCSEWYDCSSSRVDQLQQVCLQAPGTAGSRMTGAGWGGCVISLVDNQHVEAFCGHVCEHYYATLPGTEIETLKESDYMFVTTPSQGSTVFVCD